MSNDKKYNHNFDILMHCDVIQQMCSLNNNVLDDDVGNN